MTPGRRLCQQEIDLHKLYVWKFTYDGVARGAGGTAKTVAFSPLQQSGAGAGLLQ
jgi:hypothetical protein